MKIGAHYLGNQVCEFIVWAPAIRSMVLRLFTPEERRVPLEFSGGYWRARVEQVSPGVLYDFRLDDLDRPDPASHFQPRGVHAPSQVVDHGAFAWRDEGWRGIPLPEMIVYELHVGTFTPEGNFEGIIPRIAELRDLGVNALEMMPIAQFPGERNWGYDGTYPFAVQNSYGGPEGLKRLVDACHRRGMAVILDVVYNHLGPEGNYLSDFAPYFTDKYRTPWGRAINFDDAWSDEVRNFFIENALHWLENYHIDALRLDAIHGITDMSARPFLQELAERVEQYSAEHGRKFYLIAESDLNDVRAIRPRDRGGYGLDAQWNDDFHHALHTLLTGESEGYNADFGALKDLAKSLREGFVYSGGYSRFRKRSHGSSSADRPPAQFIVSSQNHDQIGNRLRGERLSRLVSFGELKLAAGVVLLSPYIPLLFMGEEYGEEAPFLYFVSHGDSDLIEAVRKGRREEFASFAWTEEPSDPQDARTFRESKIHWDERNEGDHGTLLRFYRHLIHLRRSIPAFADLRREGVEVKEMEEEKILWMRRRRGSDAVTVLLNFHSGDREIVFPYPGAWQKVADSAAPVWLGPGPDLPEHVDGGVRLVLRGSSFAAYREGGLK